MICVSIAENTPEKCIHALKGIDFAEIRIEKMDADTDDIHDIFAQHSRLIATCRPGTLNENKRKSLLMASIEAGAAYVDIEVESNEHYKNALIQKAHSSECRVIISYHNFEKTPHVAELEHIINWCFDSGADIAKIACHVHSERENARLLGLLDETRSLVVVGMGNKGKASRILAPFLGSLFTYASLTKGMETAEGQIDLKTLTAIFQTLKNA